MWESGGRESEGLEAEIHDEDNPAIQAERIFS